jgi:hypothetical protein
MNSRRQGSRIELLFTEECPHREETRRLITEILEEEHLDIPLFEVCVRTAEEAARHRFIGSPSVRVNGEDIEHRHKDVPYTLACRLYRHEDRFSGVPPKALIRAAVLGVP